MTDFIQNDKSVRIETNAESAAALTSNRQALSDEAFSEGMKAHRAGSAAGALSASEGAIAVGRAAGAGALAGAEGAIAVGKAAGEALPGMIVEMPKDGQVEAGGCGGGGGGGIGRAWDVQKGGAENQSEGVGKFNRAYPDYPSEGGGGFNRAYPDYPSEGGGGFNRAYPDYPSEGGGKFNRAVPDYPSEGASKFNYPLEGGGKGIYNRPVQEGELNKQTIHDGQAKTYGRAIPLDQQ